MIYQNISKLIIISFIIFAEIIYKFDCFRIEYLLNSPYQEQVASNNYNFTVENEVDIDINFAVYVRRRNINSPKFLPLIDNSAPLSIIDNCTKYELGFCSEAYDYPENYIEQKLKSNDYYKSFFAISSSAPPTHPSSFSPSGPSYNPNFRTSVDYPLSERRTYFQQKGSTQARGDIGDGLQKQYFTSLSPSSTFSQSTSTSTSTNRGDGGVEMPAYSLCGSVSTIVHFKKHKNINNTWRFIVNQKNFTQNIRVEKCLNPGGPCAMNEIFPNGHRTECRQEYTSMVLLALDGNGELIPDIFSIPTCCKCYFYTF